MQNSTQTESQKPTLKYLSKNIQTLLYLKQFLKIDISTNKLKQFLSQTEDRNNLNFTISKLAKIYKLSRKTKTSRFDSLIDLFSVGRSVNRFLHVFMTIQYIKESSKELYLLLQQNALNGKKQDGIQYLFYSCLLDNFGNFMDFINDILDDIALLF
ncbi:hypothetical protein PPERSA_08021 [Pseudocohnilembus persalinus]|uniref:Uncharacterized protein n=1 Tax=Pseudocohnilembus persalinus TaxID=266149 RepID=A0A0V0R2I0_PSEPJ|nr:hypothetical protein PPERSA_08021 [Pseudocohnilembus persalinus]|eukprot:KRX08710.1 hypothetical protein PPERSA_08021 [Pseudocohnilembus persalinus]